MTSEGSGGRSRCVCTALFYFHLTPRKEQRVMECKYGIPIFTVVERLQETSQQVGLSEDDVVGLLASGLDVLDVVSYVEAVLSNRVN